jgi:hypothetical protein
LQSIATWVTDNSGNLVSDWNDITNKPTEFTPTSHTHHASSINAGVLDPARIPVINTSIQVISPGGIADLTLSQQNEISAGALVTTTDGQRYVYTSGSKTNTASYILLADITPEWSVIANKPLTFTPVSHTHDVSEVVGLTAITTWVAQNSSTSNNTLGNSAYALITANSATWESDGGGSTDAIINYIFDGGTNAVSVNSKGNVTLPSDFIPTEWRVISDLQTTTTVNLNKASYANYPTMTSVGTITMTNTRKNSNSSPGFANLSANDIVEFIVSANSAATKLTVSLKGYKI